MEGGDGWKDCMGMNENVCREVFLFVVFQMVLFSMCHPDLLLRVLFLELRGPGTERD